MEALDMLKKRVTLLLIVILGVGIGFSGGCARKPKTLVVYAGKGLGIPVNEIKTAFELRYSVKTTMVYAGSSTLVRTLEETRKGDVLVPGSTRGIKKAGDLVLNHRCVSLHIPIVAVHKDNPKNIQSFDGLAKPGVTLTIGNADMCAIGRAAEKIIAKSELRESLTENTVIRSAHVGELLNLLIGRKADAAIVWQDMLRWPQSRELEGVEIPSDLNEIEEIHVAVLTTSEDKKTAQLFADFVATEGKATFEKGGFGKR